MKPLRKFLDKIKPNFQKGGKLYFLHSVFDGFESFLFVPDHVTKRGAHIRDSIDLKRTMIMVVIALVPALIFGMFNVGVQYYLAQYRANPDFSDITWRQIIPIVGYWKLFWFGF
jgi:Na+-transporting NADH:ubiquinone oxidoreductase subunit B